MSSLNTSFPSHIQFNGSYGSNLFHAARLLVAALLNAKPVAAESGATVKVEEVKPVNFFSLYRLASRYETSSPQLAKELRAIANRY